MALYNEKHEEIPDNTPVEMPIGYERPESLESMIARMVKTASIQAKKTGQFDTDEEADDFETGEEEPVSPYQFTDMEEEAPRYVRPKQQANGTKTEEKEPEAVPPVQPVEKAKETPVST